MNLPADLKGIRSNTVIFVFLMALLGLWTPRDAGAVCAQSHDVIILFDGGSRITGSGIILVTKETTSEALQVNSVCLDGICNSNFHEGDISNVFFVKVTAGSTTQELGQIIAKAKENVLENNYQIGRFPGEFHYYTDLVVTYEANRSSSFLSELSRGQYYPFPDINQIPNEFTYENCHYQRNISYDIKTGKLETYNHSELFNGTEFQNNPLDSSITQPNSQNNNLLIFYLFVLFGGMIIAIVLYFLARYLRKK